MNIRSIIVIGFCVLLGGILWYYSRHPLTTTVHIRSVTYFVEIAATPKEKELGLGGRESLLPLHGMLFPYDHAEQFSYWMKGMRFPIDIIWIRGNTIVDITKHIPTPTPGVPLAVYASREPVDKVLEIPSGDADTYGFQIGDGVRIDN